MQGAEPLEIGAHAAARREPDHGVASLGFKDRKANARRTEEVTGTVDHEIEHRMRVQG